MKDGEKTYSTSQIAGIVGLHPNTVRKYEEWGLLQTPEHKPNGYRVYTDVHIKQFELAKKALQSVIVQAGRCTTLKLSLGGEYYMSKGIMIIGPSGSGKTSLGKMVADKLGYPYFDVDDYIWRRDTEEPYTVMYSREEKINRLSKDIFPYEHFVMAGSMSSFHYAFDDKFDMMVFLYAEPAVRIQRVHERAVERFGERVLEGGDLYESHLRFLDDNRRYEKNGSPNLNEQREWLNNMSCMKIELDGKVDLESNSNIIVERWNQII